MLLASYEICIRYALYIKCVTIMNATIAPRFPKIITNRAFSLNCFPEVIRIFSIPRNFYYDALATYCASDYCPEKY